MSNAVSIELNGTKLKVDFDSSIALICKNAHCRGCEKNCRCDLKILPGNGIIDSVLDADWTDFYFVLENFEHQESCYRQWRKQNPDQAKKEFSRCLQEETFVLCADDFRG